jgi:predicted membrane-bound mannosyltransferase
LKVERSTLSVGRYFSETFAPVVREILKSEMKYANDTAVADLPTPREQIVAWKDRLAEIDWTPWLIVGLAALLRFFLLGIKPPHFDEGINGWFVDQLAKNGFYRYDPTNYHGPLHFYILFLSQTLFGRNLWALRLPVVLVSTACVWLTLKFEPFVGRNVCRVAALAMAVSPGFVFYGRYSIHEVWLVLFSMLFILGLLGLWRFGTANYLWSAGMGVTGMILTKETYIIHAGCAAVAGLVCYVLNRLSPLTEAQGGIARSAFRKGPKPVLQQFQLGLAVHLLSSACLISTAFVPSRWQPYLTLTAPVGFITAFALPMQLVFGKSRERQVLPVLSARWLTLFFFSMSAQIGLFLPWPWNALIWIVALPGLIAAYFIPNDRVSVVKYNAIDLGMVVATGALAIVFFYSGTFFHWSGVKDIYEAYAAWFATGHEGHGHEKPWYYWLKLIARYEWPTLAGLVLCLFCHRLKSIGLRYLAIYGVGTLIAYSLVHYKTPWCIISIIWPLLFIFGAVMLLIPLRYSRPIVAILLLASLGSSIWLNYFRCTTPTEPYVYVQTYNDIDKLTRPLLALAKRNPIFYQLTGHIIRNSSYPLPWILGDFPHVGYYENQGLPQTLDADFLLVQSDRVQEIEAKLHNSYFTTPLTIRPYQDPSKVYFDARKFKDFFPGLSPDFTGKGPG